MKLNGIWGLRLFDSRYWIHLTLNEGGTRGIVLTLIIPRNGLGYGYRFFIYFAILLGKRGWHRWKTHY